MGNQAPPVIDAVQDRHVEQVVLSGSRFVSSIFGSGAHSIAALAAPVFYTEPVISGGLFPPSVLSCTEGAFNSSPRAVLTYKWKKDTVDIPTETNPTYTSVLGDIGSTITCEVTATNGSGADTGLSNGLVMAAYTNSYIYELDVMPITGLSALGRVHMNAADIHVMTGMPPPATETIVSLDAYVIWAVEHLTPLVVVNGDAENSVMTDWTMDFGNVQSVTTASGAVSGWEGSRFFLPDELGQGVDSQMSQVIAIPAGDYTDVDTGDCLCICHFMHMSTQDYDGVVVTMEALDAGSGVLATNVFTPPRREDEWRRDSNFQDPLFLPTLTRSIKLTVLFDNHATLGNTGYTVHADAFYINLMKLV